MTTRKEILAALEERGLGVVSETLSRRIRPAVTITTEKDPDADKTLGASCFGGWPDLPHG